MTRNGFYKEKKKVCNGKILRGGGGEEMMLCLKDGCASMTNKTPGAAGPEKTLTEILKLL